MNIELKFVHLVPHVWESLSNLPRTGWVKRGIKNPETVAVHTCSLKTLAALILQQVTELTDVEKQRVLDMLEIHDWPEYHPELGDIPTPELGLNGYMNQAEKAAFENQVMLDICRPLGTMGAEILSLWRELCEHNTLVSQIAHQLDKLQPILLAISYEERGESPGMAQGFYDYAREKIIHPVLVEHLIDSVRATNTIN